MRPEWHQIIVKSGGISWAGIEGGLDLEGKPISMLVCVSIYRRGRRRDLVIEWADPRRGVSVVQSYTLRGGDTWRL